ncbi:hypothetical protein ABK040_009572 [Willaertia magna]
MSENNINTTTPPTTTNSSQSLPSTPSTTNSSSGISSNKYELIKKSNSFASINEISNPQIVNSSKGRSNEIVQHYVIVLVGLPARGKSYIARQLSKHLNWLNIETKVFNAGEKRRQILGAGQSANFFNLDNKEGFEQRKKIGRITLQEIIDWINNNKSNNNSLDESNNNDNIEKKKGGGNFDDEYMKREIKCAIFDATNTTRERRQMIIDVLTNKENIQHRIDNHHIIFVESICNDSEIIEANVRDIKIKSDDYKGVNPVDAIKDFIQRIKAYENAYETICDDFESKLSYIKMIDVGKKFILNRIGGFLPGKVLNVLMNMHLIPRTIWLSRHGQSEDNEKGLLGGDSNLSAKGQCYGKVLYRFVKRKQLERRNQEISIEQPSLDNMLVWTSLLRRTIQTSKYFTDDPDFRVMRWKCLNELNAGIHEGWTYERIEKEMPNEFKAREQDKFRYRPPGGESYLDMLYRTEPAINELERQRSPLLIIGHQAVNRLLYSYLTGNTPESCTRIPIPLHTIIEIIPNAYGYEEKRYDLNEEVEQEYLEYLSKHSPQLNK